MAAGLGFKTFAVGEILSAANVNGYLMQGVWVFANAAARTAAVTSPQEGNFSYLKDTNSTEYYTGSAWVAVGGGGGGGGGMTLLSTTSLTGASTTVGSIDQTYKDLIVTISGMSGATNGQDFAMRPNAVGIVYQVTAGRFDGTNYAAGVSGGYMNFTDGCGHNNSTTVNSWTLRISEYAATDKRKAFAFTGLFQSNQSGAPIAQIMAGGGINTNNAISSLEFFMSSGNLSSGTVLVYGVK
jgi:hypothetical protein